MSKGFSSSIDLLKEIKGCKEEGQQEQINFIKEQSEMQSACNLPNGPHCPKPGAMPSLKPPSTGINLKVENTFGSTTINGKTFDHMDKINEHER